MYAGGERPFFEDIGTIEPTVYMIHNLLTLSECTTMIEQANQQTFQPVLSTMSSNPLIEFMTDNTPYRNVERTVLHPGFFQSLIMKAVDERIEQVTGFPINRYSEWIIDRLTINSTYHPHYDNTLVPSEFVPHATITVYLNDLSDYSETIEGGELVYPTIGGGTTTNAQTVNGGNTDPIRIQPTQGLGVVHHNVNEKQRLETHSLHALLPIAYKAKDNTNDEMSSSSTSNNVPYLYIARKYILPAPISKVRRYTIPVYLILFGRHGRTLMTNVLSECYQQCIQHFGIDHGNLYFDSIIVGAPVSILVLLVAFIGYYIYRHVYLPNHHHHHGDMNASSSSSSSTSKAPPPTKQQQSNVRKNQTHRHHPTTPANKKKS